jgi:hypothetical protein
LRILSLCLEHLNRHPSEVPLSVKQMLLIDAYDRILQDDFKQK